MPDAGIGVAVFTNDSDMGGQLAGIVAAWAYDWWLDVKAEDRTATAMLQQLTDMRTKLSERIAADFEKRANRQWQLSRPREAYAGTYVNDLYGTFHVRVQGGAIDVRLGNLHCIAMPFTGAETMRVELVPGQGQVVTFEPTEGDVERIIWDGEVYIRVGAHGRAN